MRAATFRAATFCLTADLVGGASDIVGAHVLLVMLDDYGKAPHTSFLMQGTLTLRHRVGYVMVDPSGTIFRLGGIEHHGEANTTHVTDIETDADEATATGSSTRPATCSRSATRRTSAAPTRRRCYAGEPSRPSRPHRPATATGSSPAAAASFPSATRSFFGDMSRVPLNGPIVGSIATPTGQGLLHGRLRRRRVHASATRGFHGSMGNARLNRPVVGLVPTADNRGYWLVASDGGVFSFDAPFHGSMGATPLNQPIVTMVPYAGRT